MYEHMKDVFVSYKRVDKDYVFPIVKQIEDALGPICWIDLEGIESNAQFQSKICKAIDEATIFLFMYSKTHLDIDMESDWTVKELTYAMDEKQCMLVNLDGSKLYNVFKLNFQSKNNTDATDPRQIQKLIDEIGKRIGKCGRNPVKKLTQSEQRSSEIAPAVLTFNVRGVPFNMVRVEPDAFMMGTSARDMEGFSDEENDWIKDWTQHQVTLTKSFYVGETQVTQELWSAVMGENPSCFITDIKRPVEQVSWNDCQKFIQKLSGLLNRRFSLPTEAEWEFAARGGKNSDGYKYAGSDDVNDVAWSMANSICVTHPVKTKKPNELGIYDMSGNVWEWCQDIFGDYEGSAETDPTGSTTGSFRVIRGGCWNYDAKYCRTPFRNFSSSTRKDYSIGLRLVLHM